jgi:ATP-dependent RNA helicase RhlE
MSFSALGISSSLVKKLATSNYKMPYPIQEKAIPAILKDKDILGIAPTGTGKTASFVLPILMKVEAIRITKNRHIQALVMVPTRELAVQVEEVFWQFASVLKRPVRSQAVFGGVSINPQMKALQDTNILVATPGRLLELVASNAVNLSEVRMLVLDEADKMLNLGFKEEMNHIIALLPKERQNMLYSATLNEKVEEVNRILLKKPLVIKVGTIEEDKENFDRINQMAYAVEEEQKGPMLRFLIKNKGYKQILVFVESGRKADNVASKLEKNGVMATAIHGKKSQGARTEALNGFKKGKIKVLIATDLLSRGIDIEDLACVINYQLPRSPKDYIHRIGRTGRAEAAGDAISLISPDEVQHFGVVQKKMGKQVAMSSLEGIDLQGL